MRILVATCAYPPQPCGGYEIQCQRIVDYLLSKGHEVHVVTSRLDHHEFKAPEYSHVHRVWTWGTTVDYTQHAYQPFLHAIQDVVSTRRVLNRVKPELMYIWSLHSINPAVHTLLRSYTCPYVYQIADPRWWDYPGWHREWIEFWNRQSSSRTKRLLKQGLRKIIEPWFPTCEPERHMPFAQFVSKARHHWTVGVGFNIGQSWIIHDGVDTNLFKPGQATNTSRVDAPLRILNVGQLYPEKGLMTLAQALELLDEDITQQISLTIVGSCPEPKHKYVDFVHEVKNLLEGLTLAEPVTFAGKVSNQALLHHYQTSDIFVFPSEIPEGQPLVLGEAMASGLCVVTTTLGGTEEIVDHGENAWSFTAGNVQELAEKLDALVSRPEEIQRLKLGARSYAVSHLEFTRLANKTEQQLIRILDA